MSKRWIIMLLAVCLLYTGCAGSPTVAGASTAAHSVEEDIQELHQMYIELDRNYDTYYTSGEVEMLAGFMADKGYTVINERQRSISNHQRMLEFVEAAAAGRESEAVLCKVSKYGILWVKHFRSSADGIVMDDYDLDNSELVPTRIDIEALRVDNDGYLWVDDEWAFSLGRIVPQPQEYVDAYLTYVEPVSEYGGYNVLFSSWDISGDIGSMNWDHIFESLMNTVGGTRTARLDFCPECSPDHDHPEFNEYPAELYEGMLQQYFDVSTEMLRAQELYYGKLYDEVSGIYRSKGYQGSGLHTVLEVRDIRENPNGSLTLHVMDTYNADLVPNGILLTVMPDDSGFKYLSSRSAD